MTRKAGAPRKFMRTTRSEFSVKPHIIGPKRRATLFCTPHSCVDHTF